MAALGKQWLAEARGREEMGEGGGRRWGKGRGRVRGWGHTILFQVGVESAAGRAEIRDCGQRISQGEEWGKGVGRSMRWREQSEEKLGQGFGLVGPA